MHRSAFSLHNRRGSLVAERTVNPLRLVAKHVQGNDSCRSIRVASLGRLAHGSSTMGLCLIIARGERLVGMRLLDRLDVLVAGDGVVGLLRLDMLVAGDRMVCLLRLCGSNVLLLLLVLLRILFLLLLVLLLMLLL